MILPKTKAEIKSKIKEMATKKNAYFMMPSNPPELRSQASIKKALVK